jgi:AraC-like DNA-binding protein
MHAGLSIKEIAERCEFANAFHFSRKLKLACGQSPHLWRSQEWSGE